MAVPSCDNFLDAISNPKLTAWYDECCGVIFDPETIDELITKRRVSAIAIRRATGKDAYVKRQPS